MSEADEMMAAFKDLDAAREEPLHPDLVPYLSDGTFGPHISHRLVHEMFVINGHVNRTYLRKIELLKEMEAAHDWFSIISLLIERPYRCEALIDYVLGRDEEGNPLPVTSLTDPEMRDLVAFVWTDSENIHQHVDDWLAITDGHVPGEPLLFGDQPAFDALPLDSQGRLEVWRGDCNDGGWSWTIDRRVAEFFCKRWDENNDLLHGFVDKRYVFGYLTNRSETEVMVRREHVQDMTRTAYPCQP